MKTVSEDLSTWRGDDGCACSTAGLSPTPDPSTSNPEPPAKNIRAVLGKSCPRRGSFCRDWTLILSAALIRGGGRILGGAGLVAAALLFSSLPSMLGIESPILLTLSGIVWQLWTFALAIRLWRQV